MTTTQVNHSRRPKIVMTTTQKTIILTVASPSTGTTPPRLFLDRGYHLVGNERNCPISRVLEAKITPNARLA
jgi:hypothetical protein